MKAALQSAKVAGSSIESLAIDTTGSSVIPVDENLQPLDDYYMWCDHRAWKEAARRLARPRGLPLTSGYRLVRWHLFEQMRFFRSCCTGCETIRKKEQFATGLEHCDMAAATTPQTFAMLPMCRAASARWGISGCGIRCGMAFLRKSFWYPSVRLSRVFAGRLRGGLRHRSRLRGGSRTSGRDGWDCGLGFRFRLARLTRTGMRLGRARGLGMW